MNTFGIEARCACFAEYDSVQELMSIITNHASMSTSNSAEIDDSNPQAEKLPTKILHIGSGSNLLFLHDYDGLVLHSKIKEIEVYYESDEDVVIRVGSGMVFDELVDYTLRQGWFGLENLSLIPGEVGASAVQNIGAYGVEAKDFIVKIELVDLKTGEQRTLTNSEAQYGYRYSLLKSKEMWGKYAVTFVHFCLKKTFEPQLEYGGLKQAYSSLTISDEQSATEKALLLRQAIIEMRQSKLPDPHALGNAGSFFMNPIVERSQYEKLISEYPTMPHYEVDDEHVKVPAGWLIEQSGWKGKSLGRAGVYDKQALVLVNLGGATGQDIVTLSDAVRKDVFDKFGIAIHPEVNFI